MPYSSGSNIVITTNDVIDTDDPLLPTHCHIGWSNGGPSLRCTICQREEAVTRELHGIGAWQAYMMAWECRPQNSEQLLRHALVCTHA